jgi:flagellar M-ring protein FliF
MSFIQQTTDQARDAFTTMPMQSRVISVMLVAAIAIGLAFLVRSEGSVGTEYLFGGRSFSETELDSIELAFSLSGLGEWDREVRRIKIPREAKATYLAALENSKTLPMSLQSSVQDAIDQASVFDSNDLLSVRVSHAKEQDAANRINMLPEVRQSSVEYDQGERQGMSRSRQQTASVVVTPEGPAPLSRDKIDAIKELVRGSYADMSKDDVVVIDTNASTSSLVDDDDPVERKRREVESGLEQKVRSLLVGYPGLRVAVTADIDPTMDLETITTSYDAEPTNLSSKSRKSEASSNRQPSGGVPGAGPNAITNRSTSLADAIETTESTEDERETAGVVGQTYENSKRASLQVKSVRVSVMLPTSYYETLHAQDWLKQKENDGKTASDVPLIDNVTLVQLKTDTEKNIQTAITPLLPEVAAGADQISLVEVNAYPDFPGPPPPLPDTGKIALTWLAGSWQTIAMIALALMALLVARSALKGTSDSPPREFSEGFGLELPTPPPELDAPQDIDEAMTITGGSLKDELMELVEGNPEVAANVIRNWVGEAI